MQVKYERRGRNPHARHIVLAVAPRLWSKALELGTVRLDMPPIASLASKTRSIGVLTQMLTGHGGFAQYLNRFKCRASPSCICDPECVETVPYILIECTANERERYECER
jgi:hypothetical protein